MPTKSRDSAALRKQYYFRPSDRGLLAWDVDRLVRLSQHLPRRRVPLSELRELDEEWVGGEPRPTWRAVIEHMKLIAQADLAFPIILAANGEIMDGRHRVAKAALEGRATIDAVQFDADPPPDHVGVKPDELPY